MTDLLSARLQMSVSLGFHIIFACVGMVMPFLMVVSHYRWLKTKKEIYYDLTKAWSKGVAIIFATGAVSGTVLSFELGLLWPGFMKHAGPIIGMPFSLEGTAFFLEAIALGIFLYGWDKVPAWTHWMSGLIVGVSGIASGIFVIAANAWMNDPTGFNWVNGQAVNIDPIRALFNPSWFFQASHMIIAAFMAVGFTVAGIHAMLLVKNSKSLLHKEAMLMALWFAVIASLIQPLNGDYAAKQVACLQPLKLAAAEALFQTQTRAPLEIGGIIDRKNQDVRYGIKIPMLLSFLAFSDINAKVEGLDAFPQENWPPVMIVHYAFDIMVGLGVALLGVSLLFLFAFFKKKQILTERWFLILIACCTPLGFLALEAGWTVTEVGRQPWIIYGIMRTKDALTPMPGLVYPFLLITGIYIFLSFVVVWLMRRQFKALVHKEYR